MNLPKAEYELEYSHGSVYGEEEAKALIDVLKASAPSCGVKVKQFEEAFAAYCQSRYALAVTSATAGLHLAVIAAGVGPGDEVITTPISWVSTANAILLTGASVVFADVDPVSLNIDPKSVADKITSNTKAIVVVHLYGQPCDMDSLVDLARTRGISIIEDCAHAPGAEYKGRKTGTLGDIGVFSFHQQKNMTTLGEGGMLTTSDDHLFERLLSFRSLCCRSYDPKGKYLGFDLDREPMGKRYWYLDFEDVGFNFRMTDAQAAVGLVQLGKLDGWNDRRIAIAQEYGRRLSGIRGLRLPAAGPGVKHVFHIYCVCLEDDFQLSKEDFMWELYSQRRIKVWSHYTPIHLSTAYRNLGHRAGECPVAEDMSRRFVSLPIHPRLTDEAIDYLTRNIREVAHVSV
ncbi:MAG TPA: DegT/DnrJ/EryC1/StrS family aminotransferase [Terriglobia bacterium]|jgi:perosamine synthetase|nr:DegT/DnrJ/EryC1/StrS family aminotransferase [Terriglobia bacterium]